MASLEELTQAAAHGMSIAVVAAEAPQRTAVISPTGDRTFGQLNARANQIARGLRRAGLAAGDGVALLCTNRPEFADVFWAVHRCGLRLTALNWHLTAEEIAYIVEDCEANAFVADATLAEVAGLAAKAGKPRLSLAIGDSIDHFLSLDGLAGAEEPDDLADPALGGTMLYTSGTTGRPKGVYRPPVPPSAITLATGGYVGETDVHLCTGPLYHAAPMALSLAGPQLVGAGVVMMERWDAEESLRLIERHRVTHTHMVPTMFHRLLSLPPETRAGHDTSSLKLVVHGAAPCPVGVKQALMDWLGPIVWEYYAATEGSGTVVDPRSWLAHPGTVGKPTVPAGVIVRNEDGAQAAAGEIGTVYLRTPDEGRFQYFKDPAKTSGAYDDEGEYFTLGDMGYADEEGYLYLTDRSANLIISGGVNVYPAEVDAVLLGHPAVADAATIGVPNEEWGEEVRAVVELKTGVEPSEGLAAELVEYCRASLARFKCPRQVDFIDVLPRQDNGKIYKRLLRERYR